MTAIEIIGTDALVTAITSDKITLVDFWAERCGPCRMLAPVLHALVEKYPDAVQLVKVDVDADENQALAMQYAVASIPQVTFFKNGEKIDQFV
jgi:thioredoxin